MSGSKTFPIFKILAVICLAVVSVVQITVMVDEAAFYTDIVEETDVSFLSVFYYIIGFAFLISAFLVLFSLGKRNSSAIVTSVEFLAVIGFGYYILKNPDFLYDADEETIYFLKIFKIYAYEYEIALGFSAAALVMSILDVTIGSTFTLNPGVNECIYCGRRLGPGEKCTCDLDDSYVINDFETDPVNYADDVEKRQCVFCGRLLYGTETCNCPEIKRREAEADARRRGGFSVDKPTYTPPPPRDMTPPPPRDMTPPVYTGFGATPTPTEKPRSGAFINKAFITKPSLSDEPAKASSPRYTPPSAAPKSEKPGDEKFFSKPSDL